MEKEGLSTMVSKGSKREIVEVLPLCCPLSLGHPPPFPPSPFIHSPSTPSSSLPSPFTSIPSNFLSPLHLLCIAVSIPSSRPHFLFSSLGRNPLFFPLSSFETSHLCPFIFVISSFLSLSTVGNSFFLV